MRTPFFIEIGLPKGFYCRLIFISQSGIGLSAEEESIGRSKKVGLPLAPIDLIVSTVNSIRAKGGRCSFDIIKTTIGKSEGMIKWATSAASELGLVSLEGENYTLTPLGDKFAAATGPEMRQILREIVLKYEPYHTVLLRLRNAPNRTLTKSDVSKAWYDLYKSGTDSTRQTYTGSFASICEWCGIIENRKKTVVLTDEGTTFLEGITPSQQLTTLTREATTPPQSGANANKGESPISVPVTASISINISLDTKEENAVKNLLRIIKVLRGESETSSPD